MESGPTPLTSFDFDFKLVEDEYSTKSTSMPISDDTSIIWCPNNDVTSHENVASQTFILIEDEMDLNLNIPLPLPTNPLSLTENLGTNVSDRFLMVSHSHEHVKDKIPDFPLMNNHIGCQIPGFAMMNQPANNHMNFQIPKFTMTNQPANNQMPGFITNKYMNCQMSGFTTNNQSYHSSDARMTITPQPCKLPSRLGYKIPGYDRYTKIIDIIIYLATRRWDAMLAINHQTILLKIHNISFMTLKIGAMTTDESRWKGLQVIVGSLRRWFKNVPDKKFINGYILRVRDSEYTKLSQIVSRMMNL